MAKEPSRTPKQKEYRKELANDLKNLRQHGDAGRELAKTLLEKEQGKDFYKNSTTKFLKAKARKEEMLQKFDKKLKKRLMERITKGIDEKDFDAVALALRECEEGEVDSTIAEKLIEEGQAKIVVDNLKKRSSYDIKQPCKFKKLSVNTAENLIEQGYQKNILHSLDDFEVDDHILELLMQYYNLKENSTLREFYGNYIGSGNFKGLNKKVFETLVKNYAIKVVLRESINAFEGLDKNSLLILLKNCYMTEDEKRILSSWIKDGKFGLLDNEVALKLPAWIVGKNFELFEGVLDLQVAKALTKEGYGSIVAKHPEKFGLKKEK